MELHFLAHTSSEDINEYRAAMKLRMGTPLVTREIVSHTTHKEGIAALKQINADILAKPVHGPGTHPISGP